MAFVLFSSSQRTKAVSFDYTIKPHKPQRIAVYQETWNVFNCTQVDVVTKKGIFYVCSRPNRLIHVYGR